MKIKTINFKVNPSGFIFRFLVGILAASSGFFWDMIISYENASYDNNIQIQSFITNKLGLFSKSPEPEIAVISIPENVLIRYGNPEITPRKYLADLVNNISKFQPRVIALDYIFDHPSGPKDDEALKSAIKKAGNVVIGYKKIYTIRGYTSGTTSTLMDYIGCSYGAGYLNLLYSDDDKVRKYDFTFNGDASFAHEILACYFKDQLPQKNSDDPDSTSNFSYTEAERNFFVNKQKVPATIYSSPLFINYKYPISIMDKNFNIYESDDFIFDTPKMQFFGENLRDKIVIIGDGSYNRDLHKISFSRDRDTYGVLIHATVIDNILKNDYIRKSPLWLNITVFLVFIGAVFFLTFHFEIIIDMLLIAVLIFVYYLFSFFCFFYWNLLIPSGIITASIFFVGIAVILARLGYSEKEQVVTTLKYIKENTVGGKKNPDSSPDA